MNFEKSIAATKREFEKSFQEADYYKKQTANEKHLKLLLDLVAPKEKDIILDLGTGAGYLAFPLAEQNPNCKVIGLDILTDTLTMNTNKAKERGIHNLRFISYEGMKFPFEDCSIDTIVTRYALHHFPDLQSSVFEMYRVLKKGGKLVISDPTPNQKDTSGFVDDFMKMKPDGHIKFYTFNEIDDKIVKTGLKFVSKDNSELHFPRKNPKEYEPLLLKHDRDIWEGYGIEITDDEIWIKENVLNMVYRS
jgi:ubiquinone/menaquinone biosynthesis C-methylase UbiE